MRIPLAPKTLLLAAALVAIALLVWNGIGWLPDRQIEAKMSTLLHALGDRRWDRVEKLMSPGYKDSWGHDRSSALADAREFGRHFLILQIDSEEGVISSDGGTRVWRGRLKFSGRGTTFGEMLLSRARDLREEFVFAWRRENWKPWSWALVSAAQPEIEYSSWNP
jgi:hypothetical protein